MNEPPKNPRDETRDPPETLGGPIITVDLTAEDLVWRPRPKPKTPPPPQKPEDGAQPKS